MINNSVKKPFLPVNFAELRFKIGKDSGLIDEEEYEIFITYPGPVFLNEQMKVYFLLNLD
jgi:hypothetical protein